MDTAAIANPKLEAALKYERKGYSVIPAGPDKKPLIPSWLPYQKKRATAEQIAEWWAKNPDANPAIVTGKISGLYVVDRDDMSRDEIEEYLPDRDVPIVETPRGGLHYYCAMPEEPMGNTAKAVPGCDTRGEGGYVIAPPSTNGAGAGYRWLDGLSIFEVEPPPLPKRFISFISSFALKGGVGGDVNVNPRLQSTSSDFNDVTDFLTQGRRDNDLFSIANALVKGGLDERASRKALELLALSCDPPFSLKEAQTKIDSAMKRLERRHGDIAGLIREWVLTSSGFFLTSECFNRLHLTSREEQKAGTLALNRLVKEGILDKQGDRRGCFRLVENEADDIDFRTCTIQEIPLLWPLDLEHFFRLLPKNIVVIAGEPDAGKTAFLLALTATNMHLHDIWYWSSEMGSIELRERLSKFDIPLDQWTFHPKERSSNFADVIKPDAVNIVDFLEIHDEFYKVGGLIKSIFDKLNKGVAIIALQKNRGADYGLGGGRGLEKARLYLTLEPGKARIVKAKNWRTNENPNGLECTFKLAQGYRFTITGHWGKP